jgi:hypothetical protein
MCPDTTAAAICEKAYLGLLVGAAAVCERAYLGLLVGAAAVYLNLLTS